MSRIGKLPVAIPASVQPTLEGTRFFVKGPKGELAMQFTNEVVVTLDDGAVTVKPANDTKRARSMWGMTRSLVSNLVTGVSEGFSKTLEVNGVGYRVAVDNGVLNLFLGYSHEIKFVVPEGIEIKCPKPTQIEISGADKQLVGQVASEIRALRKPEPYKGKGIRYGDEVIRRKEGKKK